MRTPDVLILAGSGHDLARYTEYLGDAFAPIGTDHGIEGFEICRRIPPRCIVLDESLQDMSGLDFLATLPDRYPGTPPPAVYLASDGPTAPARRALELGAVAYIRKGRLDRSVLLHSVETAIESAELRQPSRDRDELLALVMEAGPIATWDWNLLTDRVVWSDRLERFVGLEPGAFSGTFQAFLDMVHPEDIAAVRAAIQAAVESSGRYHAVFRMIRPDGRVRWTESRARVRRDARGVAVRMLGIDVEITAHKTLEGELRRQQAALRSLADTVPDVLTRFDRELRHQFVNAAAAEATGIPPEQYIGKSNRELGMSAALCDQWEADLRRVFATGEKTRLAFRFRTPQGVTRHFEARLSPERNAEGIVEHVICAATDVTGLRDAHLALEESERRYRQLAESIDALVYTTTPEGEADYVNRNGLAYAGVPPEEAAGLRWTELVHPDDRARFSSAWTRSLREGVPFSLPYRIRAADGSYRWFQGRAVPQRGHGGAVEKWVGYCVDIDEQTRLQQALRDSEARLRLALKSSQAGLWDWDIPSGEVHWSAENFELYGLGGARDDLRYGDWERHIHPEDLSSVNEAVRAAVAGEREDYRAEFRVLHPERGVLWLLGVGRVERDESGAACRMTGINLDITERVRNAGVIAERERRFSVLADAMPQLVWVSRADGSTEYVNRGWREYTGLSVRDMQDADWWLTAIHAGDHDRTFARWSHAARTGQSFEVEYRLRRHDGTYRWMLARASPDRDASGVVTRWFGTATDIDMGKRLEEQLRATEAELREADRRKDIYLATLAHELRNPLAPIRTAAHVLASPALTPAAFEASRTIISRQVRQMGILLDDLLDVARVSRGTITLKKNRVRALDVIDAAIESAQPLLEAKGHTLRFDRSTGEIWLEADPVRLTQALTNLLTNAAKFTDPGGLVSLRVGLEADAIVFRVRDNGVGISPEFLPKVFGMFIQADGAGARAGGLGIGLALVKGLVELHGGHVKVASAGSGHGSEFSLHFPVSEVRPRPRDPGGGMRTDSPASRAIRRVLIADDNRDAADSLALLLELDGHTVFSAASGPEALEMANREQPEVMVLDIGMPGLTGYEVAASLRRNAWGKRATLIAITGYGQAEDKQRAVTAGFDHHLTKPIDPPVLRELLSRVAVASGDTG